MLRPPVLPTFLLTCLALVTFAFAPVARAQIGASPQQCQAHYGPPVSASPGACLYVQADLSLAVTFYEGRAQAILFQKTAVDEQGLRATLPRREITRLMDVNSDGRTWEALPADAGAEIWITTDGALTAMYNGAARTLLITDKGSVDRRDRAERLLRTPFE